VIREEVRRTNAASVVTGTSSKKRHQATAMQFLIENKEEEIYSVPVRQDTFAVQEMRVQTLRHRNKLHATQMCVFLCLLRN